MVFLYDIKHCVHKVGHHVWNSDTPGVKTTSTMKEIQYLAKAFLIPIAFFERNIVLCLYPHLIVLSHALVAQ